MDTSTSHSPSDRRHTESDPGLLASELRAQRGRKKLSVREVARRAGVSASLVSMIETGKASPSVTTLRRLARALEIPVGAFFLADDAEFPPAKDGDRQPGRVVRASHRKHLSLPQSHLTYELLTPDLSGQIEFVWAELEPGHPPTELMSHEGEEVILVLHGCLLVTLEDTEYLLEQGDSITFKSSIPHRVANPGPTANIHIAAITPPGF